MKDWNTKSKSIVKGVAAILGIKLIDPIEVFYLAEENTFYPIISKSACSSIKVMLIRKYVPDFESSFPEIHRIDPSLITGNKLQRIFFHQIKLFEKWTSGKKMVLVIRDPVSRFYSCYIDVKNGKNRMYQYPSQLDWICKFNRDLSLSSFLKKVCKINDALADRHFRSQTFYLNARIRKVISEVEIYDLQSFMEMENNKSTTSARLNINTESLPAEKREELENNIRFMKRFEEDIRLYAEVSASAKGIFHYGS